MNTVTANDIKTKGIAVAEDEETLVTIRGRPRYLIIPESQIAGYEQYRLEEALKKVKAELQAGDWSSDLDEHLAEIENV